MTNLRQVVANAAAATRLFGLADALRLHRLKGQRSKAPIRVQVRGLPGGMLLRPRGSDMQVVLQVFGEREYAMRWCQPYRSHIDSVIQQTMVGNQVPVIIDAGANIGASTVLLAQEFPQCRILAIEPDDQNFGLLLQNTAALSQVTAFHAGLWDQPTNLAKLYPGTGWACRVMEPRSGEPATMPGVTVPELMARDPRQRLVILKVDIEGAETSAFRANNAWADDVPLVIYEQHDNLWTWLGMWKGHAHAFDAMLHRRIRDKLRRGENDYAFLHPDELLRATMQM